MEESLYINPLYQLAQIVHVCVEKILKESLNLFYANM